MTNLQKIPAPLFTFIDKALPRSSLSPTTSLLSNYKRKSLEQSGMVTAAGAVHPHASAQSDHQSPPRPTPPHLYHLSRDIISFYTWDYSRMGQSQQVFYKKMHLDVPCNARILLVLLEKTKLVMMVCLPSVVSDH